MKNNYVRLSPKELQGLQKRLRKYLLVIEQRETFTHSYVSSKMMKIQALQELRRQKQSIETLLKANIANL